MVSDSKTVWYDHYQVNPEEAWASFLQQYNGLISGVIHKMIRDHDEAMDAYTFALEKLREENCQKLTGYFAKSRNYNFETWIAIVVKNCCLDWFRKQKGRKRLLKCIKELPAIDQWIFRYIYWQRYSYDMVFELLKNKHGLDISFEEMCSRIDQLNDTLQQKTKWKLYRDWSAILPPLPIDDVEKTGREQQANDPIAQPDLSPEEILQKSDTAKVLEEVLHSLPDLEQLIIQLHYYRNLTLEEITRILKMKNIWRVHRKLAKALKLLRKKLQKKGIGPADFDIL
jgi:RNA polymerase sigma factor (sigma-70 family)